MLFISRNSVFSATVVTGYHNTVHRVLLYELGRHESCPEHFQKLISYLDYLGSRSDAFYPGAGYYGH
jgi:hypothetical protein